MSNQNPPKNKMWLPENLQRDFSCFESNLGILIRDLTASGNKQYIITPGRVWYILNNFISETIMWGNDYLLLRCCGRVLVDQNCFARSEFCDQVWVKLEECGIKFSVQHYNIYLQNCIDNRRQIHFGKFLGSMRCKPDIQTLTLLLECSCENGDAGQADQILHEMKCRGYTIDSKLFNTLVLGYAANGGLIKANVALETMKRMHMKITSETYFNLLRGLALYNNKEEFVRSLEKFRIRLKDHNYFDLLLTLGSKGNYTWLKRVLEVSGSLNMSNQDTQQLTLLCKQLIYINQSDSAIFYYILFVKPLAQDDGEYAFTLLEDMLFSKTPVEKIITLVDNLMASKLNSLALEKLTNVALRNNTEVAMKLLEKFTVLIPKYFWPILNESGQKQGEIGIFSTLKKMIEWGVRPDCETLEDYCIPFCSSNNYQNLYARLRGLGLNNLELIPPFMRFFLKKNDVDACLEMCKNNEVGGVSVEQFLQPLATTWRDYKYNKSIAQMLQYIIKMSNEQLDHSGIFLCLTLRSCHTLLTHQHFLNLLTVMKEYNMLVSVTKAELLLNISSESVHQYPLTKEIKRAINLITYPLDINLQQLESQLKELQQKNLETRAVLSKLIPSYCKLGNEERVEELRRQFKASGYKESPAIMSSLLSLYILKGNTVGAFKTYKRLQVFGSSFKLNEFKLTNLAALLVRNNEFRKAMGILVDETKKRKVVGGEQLERNCWRLLESANNELEMETLFHYMTTNGYCQVSNVVLGPFVKLCIKRGDLFKAVEMFKNYAKQYGFTPQQFDLLCQVVKVQNKELIEEVFNYTVKVRGEIQAVESYIAALAQNGFTEWLRGMLRICKLNLNPLVKARCDRWIEENNLQPLETLAVAAFQTPVTVIDTNIVYHSIIKLHSQNNNCESAVQFYQYLKKKNENVSLNLVHDLSQLITRCNFRMPEF